ncbi:MAG: MFS transporter [Acidobacteria bacterium]|nr:MFS transporter [Acidobacteriota bacterium]
MAEATLPTGMRTFFIVWSGQLVSVVGTMLTGFGLQIWVYQETGSVTALAGIALAFTLPAIVISPFAGALVDRWDRRKVMLYADLASGLSTLIIALLFITNGLALWHIYLLIGVGNVGNSFQSPAWMATIPLIVPKAQLGRANGLVQLNEGVGIVAAPAIAGVLLLTTGLGGVLIVDFATFLVAVSTLAVVRFPRPKAHAETSTGSIRGDAMAGWHWVRERKGLFGLLWVYAGVNFTLSFGNVLIFPLILAFASEGAAGSVLSVAGFGMIGGSVLVSAWGGPKRRVRGTMMAIFVAGLGVALAGLRPSVIVVGIAAFIMMSAVPVANAASQVLWQSKVPPAVQGRVFAIRRMISQGISPLAILLAGPLADKVFEPLLAEGGRLAGSVGSVIGTGPGRGIGLMYIVTGLLTALLGIIGYSLPRVRHLETELPDYIEDSEEVISR